MSSMSRLMRLLAAIGPRALEDDARALAALDESTGTTDASLRTLRDGLTTLTAHLESTRRANREWMASWSRDAGERADLAALSGPHLLSHSIQLEGSARRRLAVRRIRVGTPLETRFDQWMATTRCAKAAPDAQALWDGLVAAEARASGGLLRCGPSTILDVGPATIEARDANSITVSLLDHPQDAAVPVVAVPRCTYDWPQRKLRNFGHWLLDALPHVVSLAEVAPHAQFLLPDPLAGFQRRTLGLVGVPSEQVRTWKGEALSCGRLLLLESDGRAGGGRPFTSILAMRQLVQQRAPEPTRRRRIYVSRRDARRSRRWLTNEPDVEALFASRGFEILFIPEWSLDEQVRIFGEAQIVAGVSGAGLSDIVFSAPGTHVVVIHSDSLMRWYAAETGARSNWALGERASRGELAALGDSPRFYAHVAAALSQPCHAFLGPDDAPIDELASFLDEVLTRVGNPA